VTGEAFFVALSDEACLHLALAIRSHRNARRARWEAVPAELVTLETALSSRLSRGQDSPSLAVPGAVVESSDVSPELVVTQAQAAQRLRCSLSTIKRRVKAGDLRVSRVGGLVRIRIQDLDAYLNQNQNQEKSSC
jgi:excisionase family DNA binding protein